MIQICQRFSNFSTTIAILARSGHVWRFPSQLRPRDSDQHPESTRNPIGGCGQKVYPATEKSHWKKILWKQSLHFLCPNLRPQISYMASGELRSLILALSSCLFVRLECPHPGFAKEGLALTISPAAKTEAYSAPKQINQGEEKIDELLMNCATPYPTTPEFGSFDDLLGLGNSIRSSNWLTIKIGNIYRESIGYPQTLL